MRFSLPALTALILFAAPAAHALESDSSQPATIEADEVEFDFREGTRTYTGDVVVVQGTLRITGDKLVMELNDQSQEIDKATTWGEPATFKQRPEGKDQDVYGEGRTIVLDQIDNTLTLTEDAVMIQAGNTARGREIVYNMGTDKMTVKGFQQQQVGGDAGSGEETGRARVIITPQEQSGGAGSAEEDGEAAAEAGSTGDGDDAE